MAEHFLHLSLIFLLAAAALSLIFQNRFHLKINSSILPILIVVLFLSFYAFPCHLVLSNDHLSQNLSQHHDCCIVLLDKAKTPVALNLPQTSFNSFIQINQETPIQPKLDLFQNKSPPQFS